jgi:hypothetical protein
VIKVRVIWLSQRCRRFHWICTCISTCFGIHLTFLSLKTWSCLETSGIKSPSDAAPRTEERTALGYETFLTWILRFLLNGVLSLASSEYWHIIFIKGKECYAFRCLYLSRALTIYFGHMLRNVYCMVSHLTIMWKPRRPHLPRSHTCTTHTVFNF